MILCQSSLLRSNKRLHGLEFQYKKPIQYETLIFSCETKRHSYSYQSIPDQSRLSEGTGYINLPNFIQKLYFEESSFAMSQTSSVHPFPLNIKMSQSHLFYQPVLSVQKNSLGFSEKKRCSLETRLCLRDISSIKGHRTHKLSAKCCRIKPEDSNLC